MSSKLEYFAGWIDERKPETNSWEETWEALEEYLDSNPNGLEYFARAGPVSDRILTPHTQFNSWKDRCDKLGLPTAWCEESGIGNPLNVYEYRGVKASAQSLRTAYTLHRILGLWTPGGEARILEVGPGFGALAVLLCKNVDVLEYYMIDNPAMNRIQEYYARESGVVDKIRFDQPERRDIDLIVSAMTLGEMSSNEIQRYIALFESVLKVESGMLYLLQHKVDKKGMVGRKGRIGLDNYPFGPQWKLEFTPSPIKTAIWECSGYLRSGPLIPQPPPQRRPPPMI